jgi:predicted outer membrane repeat protein
MVPDHKAAQIDGVRSNGQESWEIRVIGKVSASAGASSDIRCGRRGPMRVVTLSLKAGPIALVLFLATPCWATEYVVYPDGSGDFPTIQAAIDAAASGDIIELADGVFAGNGNRDIVFRGRPIVVRSASGDPQLCTINCEGSEADPHWGMRLNAGETALTVLDGISIVNGYGVFGSAVYCASSSPTVRNCRFVANTVTLYGGAASCWTGAPAFLSCYFADNRAVERGGAVFCFNDGNAVLRDCVFEGNTARSGGAIACAEGGDAIVVRGTFVGNTAGWGGAVDCDRSAPRLSGCVFEGNTAAPGWGGAMHVILYSSPQLLGCVFRTNHAASSGGAASFGQHCAPKVLGCRFEGNVTDESGGALEFGNQTGAVVTRCIFVDNFAAGVGGAIASNAGVEATISGCVFARNHASFDGGAVSAVDQSDPVIEWCTLVANDSPDGSAVSASFGSHPVIRNSILGLGSGGAAAYCYGFDASVSLECADVFGNSGGDWVGCIDGQEGANGNFSADPLFCDAAADNFALSRSSPCLPGNHPYGADCGLIGAHGMGCDGVVGSPAGGVDLPIATFRALPNPFRGITEFRFAAPSSVADITVFDLAGRVVRSFDLSETDSNLRWDGTDTHGRPLAPGTYFARMRSGEERRVLRLILLLR